MERAATGGSKKSLQHPALIIADLCNKIRHKRTNAPQYDPHKKKDRLAAVVPKYLIRRES
jgi:hypothetical protein